MLKDFAITEKAPTSVFSCSWLKVAFSVMVKLSVILAKVRLKLYTWQWLASLTALLSQRMFPPRWQFSLTRSSQLPELWPRHSVYSGSAAAVTVVQEERYG